MKHQEPLRGEGPFPPQEPLLPSTPEHSQPGVREKSIDSDRTAELEEHPVAALLSQRRIRKVVIIDDLFDYDVPELNTFDDSDLAEFFQAAEEDVEAVEEGRVLFDDNVRAMTQQHLQAIWNTPGDYPALHRQVERWLAPTIRGFRGELDALCQYLKDPLKLEVECLGQMASVELITADLIFLDRRLGPETFNRNQAFSDGRSEVPDARNAPVRAAEEKARELHDAIKPNQKDLPLIVLMSSKPVSAQDEDDFIENARLVGGMFHFVPKHDLMDKDAVLLLMGQFALSWPMHHEIQAFYNELNLAATQATKEFAKASRQLRVQDYTYIQNLSLQREGHPLGDYMLWLFSSYFGHLLRAQSGLQEAQVEIDKKKYLSLSPWLGMPSTQLAKMYQSSVFDTTVGPVSWHPRTNVDEREQAKVLDKPYLQMGDVFIWNGETNLDGDKLLYILISAACDLSYSPDDEDDRPFPADLPLLFLRGTLLPLQDPPKDHRGVQTEIFEYCDKIYRIFWEKNHFVSVEYGKFFDWKPAGINTVDGQHYERVARMRLPFALEVQHEFTNNLSRIATPVAPPLCNPIRLQLMYVDQEGNAKKLTEADEDLISFVTYRKDNKRLFQYRLSQKGIAFLFKEVKKLFDNPPADIHRDALKKLRPFDTNFFGKLDKFNTTFKADTSDRSWPNVDGLGAVRNKQLDSPLDRAKGYLWLNLIDNYSVDDGTQSEVCDA